MNIIDLDSYPNQSTYPSHSRQDDGFRLHSFNSAVSDWGRIPLPSQPPSTQPEHSHALPKLTNNERLQLQQTLRYNEGNSSSVFNKGNISFTPVTTSDKSNANALAQTITSPSKDKPNVVKKVDLHNSYNATQPRYMSPTKHQPAPEPVRASNTMEIVKSPKKMAFMNTTSASTAKVVKKQVPPVSAYTGIPVILPVSERERPNDEGLQLKSSVIAPTVPGGNMSGMDERGQLRQFNTVENTKITGVAKSISAYSDVPIYNMYNASDSYERAVRTSNHSMLSNRPVLDTSKPIGAKGVTKNDLIELVRLVGLDQAASTVQMNSTQQQHYLYTDLQKVPKTVGFSEQQSTTKNYEPEDLDQEAEQWSSSIVTMKSMHGLRHDIDEAEKSSEQVVSRQHEKQVLWLQRKQQLIEDAKVKASQEKKEVLETQKYTDINTSLSSKSNVSNPKQEGKVKKNLKNIPKDMDTSIEHALRREQASTRANRVRPWVQSGARTVKTGKQDPIKHSSNNKINQKSSNVNLNEEVSAHENVSILQSPMPNNISRLKASTLNTPQAPLRDENGELILPTQGEPLDKRFGDQKEVYNLLHNISEQVRRQMSLPMSPNTHMNYTTTSDAATPRDAPEESDTHVYRNIVMNQRNKSNPKRMKTQASKGVGSKPVLSKQKTTKRVSTTTNVNNKVGNRSVSRPSSSRVVHKSPFIVDVPASSDSSSHDNNSMSTTNTRKQAQASRDWKSIKQAYYSAQSVNTNDENVEHHSHHTHNDTNSSMNKSGVQWFIASTAESKEIQNMNIAMPPNNYTSHNHNTSNIMENRQDVQMHVKSPVLPRHTTTQKTPFTPKIHVNPTIRTSPYPVRSSSIPSLTEISDSSMQPDPVYQTPKHSNTSTSYNTNNTNNNSNIPLHSPLYPHASSVVSLEVKNVLDQWDHRMSQKKTKAMQSKIDVMFDDVEQQESIKVVEQPVVKSQEELIGVKSSASINTNNSASINTNNSASINTNNSASINTNNNTNNNANTHNDHKDTTLQNASTINNTSNVTNTSKLADISIQLEFLDANPTIKLPPSVIKSLLVGADVANNNNNNNSNNTTNNNTNHNTTANTTNNFPKGLSHSLPTSPMHSEHSYVPKPEPRLHPTHKISTSSPAQFKTPPKPLFNTKEIAREIQECIAMFLQGKRLSDVKLDQCTQAALVEPLISHLLMQYQFLLATQHITSNNNNSNNNNNTTYPNVHTSPTQRLQQNSQRNNTNNMSRPSWKPPTPPKQEYSPTYDGHTTSDTSSLFHGLEDHLRLLKEYEKEDTQQLSDTSRLGQTTLDLTSGLNQTEREYTEFLAMTKNQ